MSTFDDEFDAAVAYLRSRATNALEGQLTATDEYRLRGACEDLGEVVARVCMLFDKLSVDQEEALRQAIAQLVRISVEIGYQGMASDSHNVEFAKLRDERKAAEARNGRSRKSELIAAIAARHHGLSAQRALHRVNEDLKAAGLKTIQKTTLYRLRKAAQAPSEN